MKAKFIRMIIGRKVDAWLASLPTELSAKVKDDVVVTGGCITSMLLNEPVNDFDLYFRTRASAEAVARHYVNVFKANPPTLFRDSEDRKVEIYVGECTDERVKIVVKSAGIAGDKGADSYGYFEGDTDDTRAEQFIDQATGELAEGVAGVVEDLDDESDSKLDGDTGKDGENEKPKYRPRFLTSNAITLTDKVQIVLRFIGEPDAIHANYDFVHCTNYWRSDTRQLHLRQEALEATLAKSLQYVGSKYPICSLVRARKFIKRGWSINAGQFVKMAWQISKLDLENVETLEEQLVGVDAAYFRQLIDLLRSKGDVVDGSYLMSVIDRVF